MKITKNFINGFLKLFSRSTLHKTLKNYKYSLILVLISSAIFFGLAHFYLHIIETSLIKNVLISITGRFIYTAPLHFIYKISGEKLALVFYPLILYLSYVSTLVILSLFKGFILDPLSGKIENNLNYTSENKTTRSGFKHFVFNLSEEIKMLFFTIVLVIFAFFITYIPGVGTTASQIVHWLILNITFIFINALIFLSYTFLRWGYGYYTITKIALKRFFFTLGFGVAVTLVFFVVSLLIRQLSYTIYSFSFIFALNALIIPLAVITATEISVSYVKDLKSFPVKKNFFVRIFEFIISGLAIVIIITGIQVFYKSKTGANLLNCSYKIENIDFKFKSGTNRFSSLLKKFNVKINPEVSINLEIYNPTKNDIHIFDFEIPVYLNRKKIGSHKINAGIIKSKQMKTVSFKFTINALKFGIESLKSLIDKKDFNFRVLGKFYLKTWIGEIPIIFPIKS